MPVRATGWFLHAGDPNRPNEPARLQLEEHELPPLGDEDVLAAPIYGSWEGNMGHALGRKPVDICQARREPKVIIGNVGVVKVLEVGAGVTLVQPGQHAMIFCAHSRDGFGYPETVLGYDAPGTMGCMTTRMVLGQKHLIPIPADTKYRLVDWAAFGGKYITAWSNWQLAFGTFRLMVSEEQLPHPHVWGWGGGTTLAEIDLARRHGCAAVMLSSSEKRLATIRSRGIEAVDRRAFGNLNFDERRFSSEPGYRRAYLQAENAFLQEVRLRTDGLGVQIFVDYIGTAVFRATLKALGRNGVICTAGWKTGMVINLLRAMECIDRHQHVHTHYGSCRQALDAVQYAETHGWIPPIDERIFSFDELPALAQQYEAGDLGMFTVFSVNPE